MSRVFALSECNPSDINSLQTIISDPETDPRLKQRARSILLTLEGKNGKEIAKELNVRENSVSSWRRAFNQSGIAGLFDKENPGRRGKDAPNPRLQVIEALKNNPPNGETEWTTETLSKAVGTSVDTVRRALRDHYIKLGNSSSWKIDTGIYGSSKVIGIVGLYLSMQESAIILCISSDPVIYRLSGTLLTHDRFLSCEYRSLSGQDGCISLEDAIRIAQDNPISEKKACSVDLEAFLDTVCSAVSALSDSQFVVLHFNNDSKSSYHNNRNRKIVFDLSDSLEQWLWKLDFSIAMLSEKISGVRSSGGLQTAIKDYFKKKNEKIEPLQWVIKSDVIAPRLN